MHMTSTVSAKLRVQTDALDVLAATFPAGTVSGAPKVRALQLIHELEPHARGPYAGAVGYLGFDGTLDKETLHRGEALRRARALAEGAIRNCRRDATEPAAGGASANPPESTLRAVPANAVHLAGVVPAAEVTPGEGRP